MLDRGIAPPAPALAVVKFSITADNGPTSNSRSGKSVDPSPWRSTAVEHDSLRDGIRSCAGDRVGGRAGKSLDLGRGRWRRQTTTTTIGEHRDAR